MVRRIVPVVLGLALLVLSPRFENAVQGSGPAATELVSLGIDGLPGSGPSGSNTNSPSLPRNKISADGRYVVFESFASTLVCVDNNSSRQDIFVRDRLTGTTTLASVASDGTQGNGDSYDPAISADGRYVVFDSHATNLVPGDTNAFDDVFVRDLQAGTTTRLSVSSAGDQANSVAHGAVLSGNGRYAAFYSNASNLVPGDVNNTWDVFVRDRVAGTTERISALPGETGCCGGDSPTISADGRYVAFLSRSRLDPSFNNNFQQLFVHDRQTGVNSMAGLTAAGTVPQVAIFSGGISADGRHVVFGSASNDIVVPDANGFTHDVFLRDLDAGTTILVSQSSAGVQGNHDSFMPSVSRDGRYVAFHGWSNNLVPGDTSTGVQYDVFVRDTVLGTTTRVDVGTGGQEASGDSEAASISEDGSLVFFQSTGNNLIPSDRNGVQDVFVYGPPYPGAAVPGFQLEPAAYSVAEEAGSATITVVRNGAACSAATVSYATSDGAATAGLDYTAASGTLSFAAGETRQTFTVGILDDTNQEPDETVNLTLSDATGGTPLGAPATAVLTIVDHDPPPNRPPVAVDDAAHTNEDTPVLIAVRANDFDPDGDPLAISSFTLPAHGSLADNAGSLEYTPAHDYNGPDTFTYTISDGRGGAASATVNVTVTAVNDAPVAVDDAYGMVAGQALAVAAPGVLANDIDVDSPALSAAIVGVPMHGALVLNGDGSLTYTPVAGFVGDDGFSYQASDGAALSNVATVKITVTAVVIKAISGNVTPIPGGSGTFTGFPGGPALGGGMAFFLGTGAGGQSGLYARVAAGNPPPIKVADLGTFIPNGSGTFTAIGDFSPAGLPGDPCREAAFVGAGTGGQLGLYVAFACKAGVPSPPPIRIADLTTAIPAGNGLFTALSGPKLVATPGDPCRKAAFIGAGTAGQLGLYLASSCDAGVPLPPPIRIADLTTPIPAGTGTFTALGKLDLIAQPGDPCRQAAFIGSGAGGQGGVYVASACDAGAPTPPPIRLADASTAIPGGQGTFVGFDALAIADALTPGGPPIRVAFIGTGSAGQQGVYIASAADAATPLPPPIRVADLATNIPQGQGPFTTFLTVSASGEHTAFLATGSGGQKGIYLASTPTKIVDLTDTLEGKAIADLRFAADGFSGNAIVFTAVFADGSEGVYHVTVDFPGVNDPPVSVDDSYAVNEDTVLTVAATGLLGNDSDPEGGALTPALVSGPNHGAVSLHPDGSFEYGPVANFNGADQFTYKITDPGGAESSVATVIIVVNPVNDPPVAAGDSYVTAEDTTLTVPASGVLGNDTDVDGGALTAVRVSGPANGTLTLNANGSFTYTPAANFNGDDSFVYKANDGSLGSAPATVTIHVTAVNDPPVAVNDSYRTNQGTVLTTPAPGVLANDHDPDSPALTAVLVTGPAHGTLSLASGGSLTYTPNAAFHGVDTFAYKANDGLVASNVATVTITVDPVSVNLPPVARNDAYSVRRDSFLLVPAKGVLANDTDPEGSALTALLVHQPGHGVVLLLPNGAFLYIPAPSFVGVDTFTYKASDGVNTSNTATVAITVSAGR